MSKTRFNIFSRGIPHLIPGLLALGFLLPLLFLTGAAWFSEKQSLIYQAFPMVFSMTANTLKVTGLAVSFALFMGVGAAWAVTKWDFYAKRFISVGLCLPFAIPPYLLAGIYLASIPDSLNPLLILGSKVGAGLVFGLSLYPWIYLPMKALLTSRSGHYSELGETLGLNWWQRFIHIHFWLLLPTLGMTALLVMMEVVSDFGTVSRMGVKTLTVGVHDAMFNMFRKDWAAQLSTLGLAIPVITVALFAFWRRKSQEYQPTNRIHPTEPIQAKPLTQVIIIFSLLLLVTAGFLFPVGILIHWAWIYLGEIPLKGLPSRIGDTLWITVWVSGLTLLMAVFLNLLLRLRKELRCWKWLAILINMNYALPSVMLAIAVLFLSTDLPKFIKGSILSETIGLLVLAGCLRYLCFPYFSLNSGLRDLSPRLDDLCATLKFGIFQKIFRVYLPLTRRAIACGALLVIVNMAKELTLSQVLQPFGFQPLSIRLYSFAGMDMLEESALYSLCLILLVIYPIITLDRLISKVEK